MTQTTPPAVQGFWQLLRKPLELELSRGCPDTAIAGLSIGGYAAVWSQRFAGSPEEDERLAQSIARGLRDYAKLSVAERKRRAMAAIDLLTEREHAGHAPAPAPRPARVKPAPAPVKAPRRAPAPVDLPVGHELLESPISTLAPRAKWPGLLAIKLGLYTIRDLLYHIPRDWVPLCAIRELTDGERAAVVGTVVSREYECLRSKQSPHPLYKYILTLRDESGEGWVTSITVTAPRGGKGKQGGWSPATLPFQPGQRVFVLGKTERIGKLIDLHMEDIYEIPQGHDGMQPGMRVPLYPLTNGVYQSQVHRAVTRALAALGGESANAIIDPLPEWLRDEYQLVPLVDALRELHQPRSEERHETARRRLAFEEFLIPQLALAQKRWEMHHSSKAPAFTAPVNMPSIAEEIAHFDPTPAQMRVMAEIEQDLRETQPMNRLLQGDVGSGKTLVAASALAFAVKSGYQGAIMAPTEILAEQLFLVVSRMLRAEGIRPVLLTGSAGAADRRAALEDLASGQAGIAVGTHALIEEGVVFRRLGLVVIDEQHRFGVAQRATLRAKGAVTNTLIMTATPIPRTLAMTAYGDLDVSVLDALPPGRHPVETRWQALHHVDEAYRFIREQVAQGRQAYILCPLVEQSEMLQADAATEMETYLQQHVFPDLRVGLLHGRLKPAEKDAAMEAFRTGETHILVCTTVVEVGVDVPNATVMMIHNAERFGLSQLHQLRGRVGRSEHKSTCLLVTHPRFNPELNDGEDLPARKRLRVMLEEQDGFAIAEADLQLRGPGEYLGARQSGVFDGHIGNLLRDASCLEQARQAARAIISEDHDLIAPPLVELRRRVQRLKTKLDQFRD